MQVNRRRLAILVFLLIDLFFAVSFFSSRTALVLPYLISPIVFVLFTAFFQNPQSFIRQWNGWLIWIVKFLFLGIGALIYLKTGYFPVLDDLITKNFLSPAVNQISHVEGILFVVFATIAQIGFMIGIIFDFLVLLFPNKFDYTTPDFKISFFKALPLSILFTATFTFGFLYLGVLLAR